VQQIVPFHMAHNAEPEAVDLLLEVQERCRRRVLDSWWRCLIACACSTLTVYSCRWRMELTCYNVSPLATGGAAAVAIAVR
jgi:RPN1 N-terminal domain